MWTHELSIETSAAPEAVWALYADITRWKEWDSGLVAISGGPFEVGATIMMTVDGFGEIPLLLTVVEPNRRFATTSPGPGVSIEVDHFITPTATGCEVRHVVTIDGPAAAVVGPQMGPAITSDLPQTLAAIARVATS